MPNKRTRFQKDWLNDETFAWLYEDDKDPFRAGCSLCRYTFSLSNMGRRAVTSHLASSKHMKAASSGHSTVSLTRYFSPHVEATLTSTSVVGATAASASGVKATSALASVLTSSSGISLPSTLSSTILPQLCTSSENIKVSVALPAVSSLQVSSNHSRALKGFVLGESITKAEVLWCLQSVMTHKSLRSAAKDVSLFPIMFHDSDIAAKMQMQRDKMAYVILHGLEPYFRNMLLETLHACKNVVIGFDESLNKVSQKQQMDITIRFWDSQKNEVCARYLTSAFLGRAKSSDLLNAFVKSLSSLNIDLLKIIQVSMDGPNVNFRFLQDLRKDLKKDDLSPVLLDIGSCGLHTMHCAFKAGIKETGWDIIAFLRSLYYLFKDTPSRRAIYTRLSSSTVFPTKFCEVRWLESSKVAQRAIDILPHISKFLSGVEKEKIAPTSHSYTIVCKAVRDSLLPAKLAFFRTVASDLESFMKEFQTDVPMAPFLYSALTLILNNILDRIVKPDVLKKCSVVSLDLDNKENLLTAKQVKIGYATQKELGKSTLAEIHILTFREDCRKSLMKVAKKLIERLPLKFRLTRAISCFDPAVVAVHAKVANKRLENLMQTLVDHNWLHGTAADNAAREFSVCSSKPGVNNEMKEFCRVNERVDHFWWKIFDMGKMQNITEVMKMVMILSHGNAQVERGFSVNEDCIIENMREQTLVARRTTYDAVSSFGGVANVPITKSLIHAARNARARFQEDKERRRKEDKLEEEEAHKRRHAAQEVKELKAKKLKLMEDAQREIGMIEDRIEQISKTRDSALADLAVKPITQFPVTLDDETPEEKYSNFKGLRTVSIKKPSMVEVASSPTQQGAQGLGIMIIEGKHAEVGQGIFISDIQEGSAAEQAGLVVGDMILAVNKDTLLGSDYDSAASLLKKTEGIVTLVVCNPNKAKEEDRKAEPGGTAVPDAKGARSPTPTKAGAAPAVKEPEKPRLLPKPIISSSKPQKPLPPKSLPATPSSLMPNETPVSKPPSATPTRPSSLAVTPDTVNVHAPPCGARLSPTPSGKLCSSTPEEPAADPTTCEIVVGKETTIEINKDKMGLGLSIVGGSDTLLSVIIIHEVYPDGAAAKDGRLKPGDQILEVNSEDFRSITHSKALAALRQTPAKVKMVVFRDESTAKDDDIFNIMEVELTKKPGKGLGLSIVGRKNGNGVFISDVVRGGTAEADGRLMKGDQILAVNGQDLKGATQEEAAAVLKTATGRVTIKLGRLKATSRGGSGISGSDRVGEAGRPRTVTLERGPDGLGFSIVGGRRGPHGDLPVYVKTVFETGAAARAGGQLGRGDQILAVNGASLEGLTHQQAVEVLKRARGTITLTVLS